MSQTSATATSLTAAFPGLLYDSGPHDIITGINAEASAEMPFGVVVAFTTGDRQNLLPAASTDKIAGIVVHEHSFSKGPADAQLGTTGLKKGTVFGILRKGRIWVTVENGCARGDSGYIRYAAGAGGTQLGAIRQAAVGGETIDATTRIQFLTAASAGGLACAEVDFTAKA